jgi:alpha-aminoadipic semialdehyde synthase
LLCLDGKIKSRGLVSPASEQVWRPLLGSLEGAGIHLVEKRKKGTSRGVLERLEKQIRV